VDPRDDATLRVDFRFLTKGERTDSTWVKRSAETALQDRLLWLCGDIDQVDHVCRDLYRSRVMVRKYKPRRESLNPSRKVLLQQEENRAEDLERRVRDEVAACFLAGRMYFRGRAITPAEQGASFASALSQAATRALPDLYPHFVPTTLTPGELMQLVEKVLSGPSPKFLPDELGILELDGGKFVPSCAGVVPRRIQEHIESEGGLGGTALLAWFGGPPYGYVSSIVKACVAGLLRAGKLRIQPDDGGTEITAVLDAGVKDLFSKERSFRRATFFPAGEDDIGYKARARICKFFEKRLGHHMDREDMQIADAVSQLFPGQARRLRDVLSRLGRIPGQHAPPAALVTLQDVLEQCVAKSRQTRPTVQLIKKRLDDLRDGIQLLNLYDAELTEPAIQAVRRAALVRDHQLSQLEAVLKAGPTEAAGKRVRDHLAGDRPWRDIAALDDDLKAITVAYGAERRAVLLWQEQHAEAARRRVKAREGFATLTGEQSHHVLRPLTLATTETSAEAVAPSLSDLRDPFTLALRRAENEANERLDELLSDKNLIVKVDLGLHNRELKAEADVDALLDEIRERLLQQIASGARVRLI
jgi:hypothetical protein